MKMTLSAEKLIKKTAMGAVVAALGFAVTAGAEPPRTWDDEPNDRRDDYWHPSADDWGGPSDQSYTTTYWDDPFWGPYDSQYGYDNWYDGNRSQDYRYYESGFDSVSQMPIRQRGYFFYTDDWHSDKSRFDSWYDGWGL